MKKTLSTIIAILIITAMMAMSVSAYTDDYPYSTSYGFDAASGELLIGELFGGECWEGGENSYDRAFDGDLDTFYDPAAANDTCWTGVILSEEYTLTEIRIHPRSGFLDRFFGCRIQGSNDGNTWTDVYVSDHEAEAADYQIISASEFIDGSNTGYTYYRYVNNDKHGDVAEIELYGEKVAQPEPIIEVAAETPAEEAPAETVSEPVVTTVVVTAPQTNDNFVLSVSLMSAALIAAFIVMKKKVTR